MENCSSTAPSGDMPRCGLVETRGKGKHLRHGGGGGGGGAGGEDGKKRKKREEGKGDREKVVVVSAMEEVKFRGRKASYLRGSKH